MSILQAYRVTFEYGPPQLNLYGYVTQRASILWKKAKEICMLKDDGNPTNGFLLLCGVDEKNVEDCLKRFGFDVYQQKKMCEG